jgi:Protein of unknown function (DUF3311)
MVTRPERKGRSWLLLLLLIPFIVLLWPPFYNSNLPTFIGIPFFYWFQLLWIIITAILMALMYLLRA